MISHTLGVRNMYKSMGINKKIVVQTDSSACNGIVHREGCGKVKHLETRQLWVQDFVGNKIVDVQKVARDNNPSDCLTHHWSAVDGGKHLTRVGLKWV